MAKPTDAPKGDDTPNEDAPAEIEVPANLTEVGTRDELTTLRTALRAEVRRIGEQDDPSAEDIARASELAAAFADVEAEIGRRDADVADRKAKLGDIVGQVGDDDDEAPAEDAPAEGDAPAEDAPAEAPADAPVEGGDAPADSAPVPVAASSRGAVRVPAVAKRPTLNPSLRDIAANAPDPGLAVKGGPTPVFAAAEVPDFAAAGQIVDLDSLVKATQAKANSMGVTKGTFTQGQLCSIDLSSQYAEQVDDRTDPMEVRAAFDRLADEGKSRKGMEALVAAGGWCAPSEIRYSFFMVAEGPQLWDVPTLGINRGGLRWPISLSLADFFGLSGAPPSGVPTAATMPWEWTEADDIATVTGTGAKLCLRPPCPTFTEARLRAFGVCVTAGNLTADAYPELIRHFISNVVIAHERVMNRRHLAQAAALATAVTPTASTVKDAVPAMLGNAELLAEHERIKFGTGKDAVVEYVLPTWVRGIMRSDLAKRNGYDPEQFRVGDALLADFFDARNIRVQFVSDWQALPGSAGPANTMGAATAPTNWPTAVQGLMYLPGTYGVGRGMQLRLGLIRDSALNAENDHTAEWSEEATLVGMFGHEALLVNNTIEPGGETVVLGTTPATVGP